MASSTAVAARGDAAQAAFDRKLSYYSNEIVELRKQGFQHRPLFWTADWRPHPAVTRTLQHAADIGSSRNGQQMSAKSLQRRWMHEIQIALLRRKAAMVRAVLPNPQIGSSPVSLTEPLRHWRQVLRLDGGPGDRDHADSGTDTAIPDDDDDIVSLASCSFVSVQPSGLYPLGFFTFGMVCFQLAMAFPDDLTNGFVPRSLVPPFGVDVENIFEHHGVSSQVIDEMLAVELETYRRCFPAQPALSALQRYNRRECAVFLLDLAAGRVSNFWI